MPMTPPQALIPNGCADVTPSGSDVDCPGNTYALLIGSTAGNLKIETTGGDIVTIPVVANQRIDCQVAKIIDGANETTAGTIFAFYLKSVGSG